MRGNFVLSDREVSFRPNGGSYWSCLYVCFVARYIPLFASSFLLPLSFVVFLRLLIRLHISLPPLLQATQSAKKGKRGLSTRATFENCKEKEQEENTGQRQKKGILSKAKPTSRKTTLATQHNTTSINYIPHQHIPSNQNTHTRTHTQPTSPISLTIIKNNWRVITQSVL